VATVPSELSLNPHCQKKKMIMLQFHLCMSVVNISSYQSVAGYGLDDQGVGVRVPVEARIFTSPRRPDRL
jgi:hypothetical protein